MSIHLSSQAEMRSLQATWIAATCGRGSKGPSQGGLCPRDRCRVGVHVPRDIHRDSLIHGFLISIVFEEFISNPSWAWPGDLLNITSHMFKCGALMSKAASAATAHLASAVIAGRRRVQVWMYVGTG